MKMGDIVFIAVDTPSKKVAEEGFIGKCHDMTNFMRVVEAIGHNIGDKEKKIIIEKSTVPVGTGKAIR
jgi:UDP-glucose 6-dehydrogenase